MLLILGKYKNPLKLYFKSKRTCECIAFVLFFFLNALLFKCLEEGQSNHAPMFLFCQQNQSLFLIIILIKSNEVRYVYIDMQHTL